MTENSLAYILRKAIERQLIDVHTAIPGKVLSFDPVTWTADIEPGIKRMLPKRKARYEPDELPVLPNVPILFPGTPHHFLYFPVVKGTPVLVIFNETSIDDWRGLGEVTAPADIRRHDLCAGVAIPGLFPDRVNKLPYTPGAAFQDPYEHSPDDITMGIIGDTDIALRMTVAGDDGGRVEVTANQNGVADDWVAMAGKTMAVLVAAADAAALAAVPNDGGKIAFETFSQYLTGTPPGGSPPAPSIASTSLKADGAPPEE